jgi:hypothetical protein
MKNIVKIDEHYVVLKQYTNGEFIYARPIKAFKNLREAVKLEEEMASAVPATNAGGGHVAGLDIGYSKKKKYKFFDKNMLRRKSPKVV